MLDKEIAQGLDPKSITLRFPPEPNGRLHIGHARAICLNFSLARHYGGRCILRLDDTNPTNESEELAEHIKSDIKWLGFKWDALTHTSDYFESLYQYTLELIAKNLAYVDDQNPEQIRLTRGSLTAAGQNSQWRTRTPEENTQLFIAMREEREPQIKRVVRAKIDMAASNLNLRDPIMWRWCAESHYRLKDQWSIYPLYDFSHPMADAIEGISHSLCTLEFADHRVLYDWFIENLVSGTRPQQIEFARMNITGITTSKRKIAWLVENHYVNNQSDPRLMTLAALRKRGFTPEIIQDFCQRTPITRAQGYLELDYLCSLARSQFNQDCPRAMAVLKPIKIILENLEPDCQIECRAQVMPQRKDGPLRTLMLSREIFIEADDFQEEPTKNFFRLSVGRSVRLRSAGLISCQEVIKNENGDIDHLVCRFEHDSLQAKKDFMGNKVRATIHWVGSDALSASIMLISESLSETIEDKPQSDSGVQKVAPPSLALPKVTYAKDARIEASLGEALPHQCYQFERLGYFCKSDDPTESVDWIQTLALRDENKRKT